MSAAGAVLNRFARDPLADIKAPGAKSAKEERLHIVRFANQDDGGSVFQRFFRISVFHGFIEILLYDRH